jgi:hypothetical protein
MSFRLFVYYCALCGGWAAFLTWAIVQGLGINRVEPLVFQATLIGGLLGALVAGSVGLMDALLNTPRGERLLRGAVAGVLGLLGGSFGALFGQVLSDAIGIPVFVGWMVAGMLIGAAVGSYDLLQALWHHSDRSAALGKLRNGVYGGLAGGLIGGLLYSILLTTSTALPRSSLTLSLVLLGGSIGLMIGLTQVALKEAWLTVEEGFRPGRELLLVREETTIGRAETCDLGLFGDPSIDKLHARIVRHHNRYLLAHAGESGQTLVNEQPIGSKPVPLRTGDAIRIGRSLLRFGERSRKQTAAQNGGSQSSVRRQ